MSQSQATLTKFEERAAEFAKVRALILKILIKQPGLTVEQLSKQFMLQYGFLPRIDNRLRELRKIGFVDSQEENGLLHWYRKEESLK